MRIVSVHEGGKGEEKKKEDWAIGWGETQGEKEGRTEEKIDV
jgi:hypothetical protein